jgi:ABC-type enterochelin transport system permease subunit
MLAKLTIFLPLIGFLFSGILSRITANLGCAFKHQHILKIYGSKKTFVYDDLVFDCGS